MFLFLLFYQEEFCFRKELTGDKNENTHFSYGRALFVVSSKTGNPQIEVNDQVNTHNLTNNPSVFLTSTMSSVEVKLNPKDKVRVSLASLEKHCLTTYVITNSSFRYTFYSDEYAVEHCVMYAPAEEKAKLAFFNQPEYIEILTPDHSKFSKVHEMSKIYKTPIIIKYATDNVNKHHKVAVSGNVVGLSVSGRIDFSGKPHHVTIIPVSKSSYMLPIIGSLAPLALLFIWVRSFLMIMNRKQTINESDNNIGIDVEFSEE